MNLQFSPPKEINGVYIQTAVPTPDFWKVWRNSKSQMADAGIYVSKVIDDRNRQNWLVSRALNKLPPVIDENGKPQNIPDYTPVKTVPVPLLDNSKLLPYQYPLVCALMASLLSNGVAIDASDTGTGKTYMDLKTCLLMGYRPAIVCTKSAIGDWKKVCRYYGLTPLFVMNWEGVKSKDFKYIQKAKSQYTKKTTFKWLIPHDKNICIIFDEVHKAKNRGTQNQQVLIAAKSYPLILSSATLTDKISNFLGVGTLLGLFQEQDFDAWLKKLGLFKDSYNKWESLESEKDMLILSSIIFPRFGARIKKRDIPGFPPVQNIAKLYEIDNADQQNEEYKKIMYQIAELKNKDVANRSQTELVLRLRYRQLAENSKINLLKELVLDDIEQGYHVAVFVNFTSTLATLAKELDTKCIVYGGQKSEERQKAIEDFQSDKEPIIILNIQAGGQSISLHDLNGKFPRVSRICPTDDATALQQVLGRIHRAGALSEAINYLIYAAGTVEERVYANVCSKLNNIGALNDGDLRDMGVFANE